MSSDSSTGECHKCGTEASLAAADQDGVFRPVCRECFHSSGQGREIIATLEEALTAWQIFLSGGLFLVLVWIVSQFKHVEQAVQMPAWTYALLGVVCIIIGLQKYKEMAV